MDAILLSLMSCNEIFKRNWYLPVQDHIFDFRRGLREVAPLSAYFFCAQTWNRVGVSVERSIRSSAARDETKSVLRATPRGPFCTRTGDKQAARCLPAPGVCILDSTRLAACETALASCDWSAMHVEAGANDLNPIFRIQEFSRCFYVW